MDYWIEQFGKWPPFGQAVFIIIIIMMVFSAVGAAIWAPFKFLLIFWHGYAPKAPITNHYLTKNYYMDGKKFVEDAEEEEEEEET